MSETFNKSTTYWPIFHTLVEQQGLTCYYCKIKLIDIDHAEQFYSMIDGKWEIQTGYGYPELEHKIPRSRGGSDLIQNLVLSCGKCNRKKGSKTDRQFKGDIS